MNSNDPQTAAIKSSNVTFDVEDIEEISPDQRSDQANPEVRPPAQAFLLSGH